MSDLDDEIEIDCGQASGHNWWRGKSIPRLPKSAPVGKQAPIALHQKPSPPPDRWDLCDVRPVEFGTIDELREQLIARLEEALARAKGDLDSGRWELHSPTWPYTKIGALLMRCISIADAIVDRKETCK